MKRLLKVLVATLIVGVILCVIGIASGGDVYMSYANHRLYSFAEMVSEVTRGYRSGAMHVRGYQEFLFTESYDSIKLTLDRGEFEIYEGDALSISGGTGGNYSAEVIDGVLNISCVAPQSYVGTITIVLPRRDADESRYSKVSIDANVSDVFINADLYASSTAISVDASSIEFYGRLSTEALDIDANAASVEASWVDAANIDFDCNASEMVLTLYGYPNDYQINSYNVLGEVTLNGYPFPLIGDENTSRFLNVSVNVGSIELYTTLDNE